MQPVGIYDDDHWCRRRRREDAIAEIAVDYAVHGVCEVAEPTEIRYPNGRSRLVWMADD